MRRVLITGGSGGIGSAVARSCAARGMWPIVAYARGRDNAEQTVRACGVGEIMHLDLLSPPWNLEPLGDVDAIVHCAGRYSRQRTLLGSTSEETASLLEVNALAPLRLTEAIFGAGAPLTHSIMLLSTAMSCRGGGPYALSKAAALAVCKLLAHELAPRGTRVHAIVPGWTDTPMAAAAARANGRTIDDVRTDHPEGQLLEPDRIGELVTDLLAEGDTYETGQLILWDLRDSDVPVWTTLQAALALDAAPQKKGVLMRILVTGSQGYIGSVLVPCLLAEGHEVVGIDTNWFDPCVFSDPATDFRHYVRDVRDVTAAELDGFDAVMHLAGLSNDPLCNLDPALTYEINHVATVRLARLAKQAGVPRFLFSSSCSTYGASGDNFLDEEAALMPVTPYGDSKVKSDRDLAPLADDEFSPVCLRNATAYGISPRLRFGLVLNDFVAMAFLSGKIRMLSDGTPWRPVVHVEDICRTFIAVLSAPREAIHNQVINVGSTEENYRIGELADIVCETIPGVEVTYAENAGPDKRCYRIDCRKLAGVLPNFKLRWNVHRGVQQLYNTFREVGLTPDDYHGRRFDRLHVLQRLLREGQLDKQLRWTSEPSVPTATEDTAETVLASTTET